MFRLFPRCLGQGPTQCLAQASCTGGAGRSVDGSCGASDCESPSATKVQHWHLESDTPHVGLSHLTPCLRPRCFPSPRTMVNAAAHSVGKGNIISLILQVTKQTQRGSVTCPHYTARRRLSQKCCFPEVQHYCVEINNPSLS